MRYILIDTTDISVIELPVILSPFFAIIRSPLSTGPITAAALSALHSFFDCGLISSKAIALETALVEMSIAVSHCKFEASDASGDEVVLLKIMAVIQDCLCGTVGKGLGDIEVCEMLETVLTTCCQMRLSGEWTRYFIQTHSQLDTETLRRSAEHTMHALVRTVFSRLHFLDPEKEEARLRPGDEEIPDSEIKMTVQTTVGVEEETQAVPSVHRLNAENGLGQESLTSPRVDRPQCMLNQSFAVDEAQISII